MHAPFRRRGRLPPVARTLDDEHSSDVLPDEPVPSARRVVGAAIAEVLPNSEPVTEGKAVVEPSDLEDVRSSYDRVADTYVAMGIGDLGPDPWLRAALVAFAEQVRDLGPVLDVG